MMEQLFILWNNHDFLPTKKADLILACHVHNELSGSDFLRLMDTLKNHYLMKVFFM